MKIEELKKWGAELDICIRCGYCYENCHMYKLSNWESDSPRNKLILIHGLLTDAIEPSVEIALNIFECFYCRLCEDSCSANVSVTEILTDAREALIDAGFDVEGTTALVDEDVCSGCGVCVSVCKTEATSLKEAEDGKNKAHVDKAKCEGCGVCIAACPSGAMKLKEGYKVSQEELLSEIRNLLGVING